GDVAPGGTLDPGWRAVFLRHPDRFLAGTDTWMTSRWEQLPGSVTEVRGYLGQLPRDGAEKIAFRNGERASRWAGPDRGRGLADPQLRRGRLDLAPRLILDGDAARAALGLEACLRLAGDQGLGRARGERRRPHPAEERGHLPVEVGQRQETLPVEAD